MKIFTLSILASLSLAASAMPTGTTTTVIHEGPGRHYQTTTTTTTTVDSDRQSNILLIDTANTDENLDAPTYSPAYSEADKATLRQIKGDPGEYKNRDLEKEINRTYDQKKRIESDYGQEIKREILDDRDKYNDDEDGDYDNY